MARQDDHVRSTVRIPAAVYQRLKDAAGERSINAEIVARLSGEQRTLRDWFAGLALRAIIDTDDYAIQDGRRLLAINCYAIADAMLAERSK